MARNISGVFSLPAGSIVATGDTILPAQHNTPLNDIASDLNLPRPVVAGGTGADNAPDALVNLGLTATAAELNLLDGVTATTAELNLLDGVTATTAEINTLDGITATTAELNLLDGVTATTAELNAIDGVTATGTSLIRAADAAAARSTIAAPAVPTGTSGPGEVFFINPSAGTGFSLPAGGSWLVFRGQYGSAGDYRFVHGFDVQAGGTAFGAPAAGIAWVGWAWRIL